MDGKEVELALRVEAVLEDQGMEVRVKPERVVKGLIGGRGGVELGDQ
ncbi:MAG: hypothetical protein NTU62_00055 [Spirochaetes bacterium]|nr:hypothetical protein [Spirochaetota bacterium]